MQEAWANFETGDVVVARRRAEDVLRSPSSVEETVEARDLLERTRFPRFALPILGGAGAAILALLLLALSRGSL